MFFFSFQEDYHVADLRKELSNVKKLLADEQRRSTSDGQKITETQFMFAQMLKDYNSAVDQLNQLQQEKRMKVSQLLPYISGERINCVLKICCVLDSCNEHENILEVFL